MQLSSNGLALVGAIQPHNLPHMPSRLCADLTPLAAWRVAGREGGAKRENEGHIQRESGSERVRERAKAREREKERAREQGIVRKR